MADERNQPREDPAEAGRTDQPEEEGGESGQRAGRTDQPEEEGGESGQRAGRTDQPEEEGGESGQRAGGETSPTDAEHGRDVGMSESGEELDRGGRRTDEAGTPTGDRERDPDRPLDTQPGTDETED